MAEMGGVLDDGDRDVIAGCLAATVSGPFFPDWEFHTLFGLERTEVAEVADAWPGLPLRMPQGCDSPADFQRTAIQNALNNLLGYPHRHRGAAFLREVGFDEARVREVFARWRGETTLDGTGKGYFDRMA